MNLLDRIDQALSNELLLINPHDFEACATSLLSPIYDELVPIHGGSDFGLDAEITNESRTIGMIVTSSRRWDGAKQSLRGSLQSMRKNQLPVQRVIAVNLVNANRDKREKLKEIAEEFECELVQVYDQAWFANQFRENPDWRRKILNIEGGPFSFSRHPYGARPDEQQLSTVGRDALIAEVNESDSDVILFGVPGVGKSHVASRLDGALFLEQNPTPERLLDDLIETKPTLVVVDDSGARLPDVELLVRLRNAENLSYRIVATCWPHEKDHVADRLPNSPQIEVDPLSREELGAILRERGITRLPVIVHILTQADGRPAWALNLADLLIHEDDWESVWNGQAVRGSIFAFLRKSNAPEDAADVLGTMALLGQVNDNQLGRIASLLELRQPELVRLIRSVAIAGLIDVQTRKLFNRETQQVEDTRTYHVRPHIIAASVASEVYFSESTPPVPLGDVQEKFPELVVDIMQIQIYAKLLGATNPRAPTTCELIDALPKARKKAELLRSFSQLGREQTHCVVDIYRARITTALDSGSTSIVEKETKLLAAQVADAVRRNITGVVIIFIKILCELENAGHEIDPAVEELIRNVRGVDNGDQPLFANLLRLVEAIQSVPASDLNDAVWAALTCRILTPTFDANYLDPEVPNQFIFQSFTWRASYMEKLYDLMRPTIVTRVRGLTPTGQLTLIELIDKWVRISKGLDLPFGGKPDNSQMNVSERIAKDIASTLHPVITTPGVRARFNQTAGPLGILLDEPDALFAALTIKRERTIPYQEMTYRRNMALDTALAPFQHQSPEVLMEWLNEHQAELIVVNQTASGIQQVFARLADQPNLELDRWLIAAIDHGLAGSASALIYSCVQKDQLTLEIADLLLADSNGRINVIGAVIGHSTNCDLVPHVVDQLTPFDVQKLDGAFALKEAPQATRKALFTHPNSGVRGTAAALWAAEWSYDRTPMPVDSDWLDAMKSYIFAGDSRYDETSSQALKALSKISPELFIEVFTRHAKDNKVNSYHDFSTWEEAIKILTPVQRRTLWQRVKDSPLAREFFWVIAAGDVNWITQTIKEPTFKIPVRQLLYAVQFQFGPRYSLDVLANMFRPLNPEPEELLGTLECGGFSGEKHERYAATLDNMRRLATSDDERIAHLGRRGIEIYEPRLEEALINARRAAIRGIASE